MTDNFLVNPRFAWDGPEFIGATELVTFYVSKDGIEEKFLVHKEHACHYSPVLNAAFSSSFIEGQTQAYRLEDISPKIFRLLVQWLYTQSFKHRPGSMSATAIPEGENSPKKLEVSKSTADEPKTAKRVEERLTLLDYVCIDLVELYILAERLIIPRLQNYIMKSLVELFNESWSTAWITTAYEGTIASSPLRKLAVDTCLFLVPSTWISSHATHFPHEMLIQVVTMMGRTGDNIGIRLLRTRLTTCYMIPES